MSASPKTPKKPVTNTYHGVAVSDDYQWLENWDDPEVRRWSEAQNAYARAHLDKLPSMEAIRARLSELKSSPSADYTSLQYRGGLLFAIKDQPPKEQPFLVTLRSADEPASERVVVDPNKIDPSGGTAIDFYQPSLDGKRVAVSLSKGGSEDGSVRVFEAATGKQLADVVARVNYGTAGGSVSWNGAGTGFYYTRYPRKGERSGRDQFFYQQVWFHKLGTPESADRYAIGTEFPRIAEVHLETSDDGRYVLASVSNGDGGEYAHYVRGQDGDWKQITRFSDRVVKARFGPDGAIYLLSRKDAPRGRVLRLAPAMPTLDRAQEAVSEGEASISDFEPTAEKLFVVDVLGGPSQMRIFDLAPFLKMPDAKGAPVTDPDSLKPVLGAAAGGSAGAGLASEIGSVSLRPISSVGQVLRLQGDEILLRQQTHVEPPAWYRYRAGEPQVAKTALRRTSPADFSDTEVVREFATSKDGTKVPISIMRKKGTRLDGSHPTLLYAYGGYGVNIQPNFDESRKIWIEQGGIYAIANLRGGGEYGEDWHIAGNLTKKQNVFDDFAAAARYLVQSGYTTRDRLAIEGGSNGGLLMGAELVQHPDLFRVVLSFVGIYDMLRVELSPNGEFNTTEFGTVKDPEQFKALYAYSPFHHVVDGTKYPSIMFLTGANDPRVDPANSRKMTARLQAATGSGRPVFLRTSAKAGHGIGSSLSEEIAQGADAWAFLFDQLGMTYAPVTNGASGAAKAP